MSAIYTENFTGSKRVILNHIISKHYYTDINCKNDSGSTPLHHAADAGLMENYKYLVSHGADPSILDNYGKRAEELFSPKNANK